MRIQLPFLLPPNAISKWSCAFALQQFSNKYTKCIKCIVGCVASGLLRYLHFPLLLAVFTRNDTFIFAVWFSLQFVAMFRHALVVLFCQQEYTYKIACPHNPHITSFPARGGLRLVFPAHQQSQGTKYYAFCILSRQCCNGLVTLHIKKGKSREAQMGMAGIYAFVVCRCRSHINMPPATHSWSFGTSAITIFPVHWQVRLFGF